MATLETNRLHIVPTAIGRILLSGFRRGVRGADYALKPSLSHEVPIGNDLMQPKTLSISATMGGSENVLLDMDGVACKDA
ncbi:hypothetical protein Tco_0110436 [Tanacetum coccineum]